MQVPAEVVLLTIHVMCVAVQEFQKVTVIVTDRRKIVKEHVAVL